MTPQQWTRIRYFDTTEKWGDPMRMNHELIQGLVALRRYVGERIIIHCGYDDRPGGWHPKGRAVDLHIEGMPPMMQFLAALRFPVFTGIGLYPWWNSPGIHVDNRPLTYGQPRALWGSTADRIYCPIDTNFLALVKMMEEKSASA